MRLQGRVPEKMYRFAREHAELYLSSGGRQGHRVTPQGSTIEVPTLLLAVTGRRSGERLIFPLIYGRDGRNLVIVASRGGAPHHPQWYLNLEADPAVGVQVQEQVLEARARTAAGAERARLWAMMAKIWPPYDEYQQKAAGREIPVVVLEPAAA
jgi:proline iminopeptidase